MASENFSAFSISLNYMATTKLDRAIDLQIRIARMAVLENVSSHTLLGHNELIRYPLSISQN